MIYAKWGAIVVLALLLVGVGYHYGGLASRLQYQTEQATLAGNLAKVYEAQQLAAQKKQVAYEKEIDQLKDDSLKFPTVAVRLCPSNPAVPSSPGQGQVLPPAAGLGKGDDVQVSQPDYGPFMFAFADRLDKLAAKCRAD